MIRAAVVFIINNEGKFLVLKRNPEDTWMPNRWGLPGGSLNDKETHKEAAIREIKEETNLNIFEPKEIFHLKDIKLDVKYFIARNFFGNIKIDFEHTDFKWVNNEDLNNLETTPNLQFLYNQYVVGPKDE